MTSALQRRNPLHVLVQVTHIEAQLDAGEFHYLAAAVRVQHPMPAGILAKTINAGYIRIDEQVFLQAFQLTISGELAAAE